ncbi:MAG: fimbria major subunit [Tannerellaceae bacterium]|nr:fimbria major subunit [Tannerellaceae bacterium]
MKKMFKFFIGAAIVAAGFTACSEEVIPVSGQEGNGSGTQDEKESTYATFQLNLGDVASRATTFDPPTSGSDQDNVAGDKALDPNDVRLLIFNSATKSLEINEVFGTANKTVLVQAGNKKIFVFGNTKGTLSTAFKNVADLAVGVATLDNFYDIIYDAGAPQDHKATGSRTFDIEPLHAKASATTGLPVSNSNAVEYELKPNIEESAAAGGTAVVGGSSATNTFKIEAVFMIAKARLSLGDTEDKLVTGGSNDKVSEIFYTIRNLARKTNFVQNVVTGVTRSYYYDFITATTPASVYSDNFDRASKLGTTKISTTAGNYLYVPENNGKLLRYGQASRFTIKAKFEPGKVITDATFKTSGIELTIQKLADAGSSNSYVYTIAPIPGIPQGSYFASLDVLRKTAWLYQFNQPWPATPPTAEMDAIVTAADEASAGTTPNRKLYYQFTNAESWYTLPLGESTNAANLQPGVLRGKAYNAKINSITGPGVPKEDIVEDPGRNGDPIVSTTYISATIEVKDWAVVGQVGDLN